MTRPDVTSFVDTVTPRVCASRWTKVAARLQSCDMVFFKGERKTPFAKNNQAFISDKCCYLTLSYQLMEPN